MEGIQPAKPESKGWVKDLVAWIPEINPQIKRSPVSVNRMRAALSAMFKFAIQHDYVNAYPTHKVPSKIKITRRAS